MTAIRPAPAAKSKAKGTPALELWGSGAGPLPRGIAVPTEKGSEGLLLAEGEARTMQAEVAKQAAILNVLPGNIAVLDAEGNIFAVNDPWKKYAAENLMRRGLACGVGLNYLQICDDARGEEASDAQAVAAGIRSVLAGRCDRFCFDYPCHSPIEPNWFRVTAVPLSTACPDFVVIMHFSVTEQKLAELEIAYRTEHDSLTGLPNLLLLNDHITRAIHAAKRYARQFAVLVLDLDGFKQINDVLGRGVGDKLLQSVANRLSEGVRTVDTVSRVDGDEFAVLLSQVQNSEDAAMASRRLLDVVKRPHRVGEHELSVSGRVGISLYPQDGPDAETLLKTAGIAMYHARQNRREFEFFRAEMTVKAVERQFIEENLRRALERNELTLHYQPRINLKTGAIAGAEALLRWTHPDRGLISPAHFIPVAEDCGLIVPIGAWVIREACMQSRAWLDAGLPAITIAVNVSGVQFEREDFLDTLFAILRDTGQDPRLLEVEVTEGVLMEHVARTASVLQALRERGLGVAIDDFGTGYSSLSYLHKLPLDALKIDQSFVREITSESSQTSIVDAIISMGRSLKLRVVAEGIETVEQLRYLQGQHCDEGQGYYFSRPVPAGQFSRLLQGPSAVV